MIKTEDVVLGILVVLIIGIGIYLLITANSPIEVNALISLTLFIAASELLIWKKIFSIDKRTAIGFIKVEQKLNNLENSNIQILNKLDNDKRKTNFSI